MRNKVRETILVRETEIHRRNIATFEEEYEKAFAEVNSYDELLELNEWAEISRKNEVKRYLDTLKQVFNN